MSNVPFNEYQREYEAEGIGSLLYGLIWDIVAKSVKRYPPDVYSPNLNWDEDAISAVCHDFIMQKMLQSGYLEYHLLTQDTTQGLIHVLHRDFRHFLINLKQRSEYSNMFQRVKDILSNNNLFLVYYPHNNVLANIWGLHIWQGSNISVVQHLEDVVEAMFTVELPPLIRYRADSKKHSHLLSTLDLTQLLESTFQTVGMCIRLDLIMEALRYRLALLDVDVALLEDAVNQSHENGQQTYADIIPSQVDLEAEVTSKEIAEDIFERLTDRQRRVLALRLSLLNPTLEQIGEELKVSKSSVHSDLGIVTQNILISCPRPEEAEVVLETLSELCAYYFDESN